MAVDKNFQAEMKAALKKDLDTVSRRLSKTTKIVTQADPGVIESLKNLEAARSKLRQAEVDLDEVRLLALGELELFLENDLEWSQFEKLLDTELKNKTVASYQALIKARESSICNSGLFLDDLFNYIGGRTV